MNLTKSKIIISLALILLIGVTGVSLIVKKKNYDIWLCDYYFNSTSMPETDGVVDIIFLCVDHWEPGDNEESVNRWMSGFRSLADLHIDSDGEKLKHTFYYPIEHFRGYQVDSLVQLCSEGYGDIEVHLHHFNDSSESLRQKFITGIDSLQSHGALISENGETHFSFIHGNWALDNSHKTKEGVEICGVNDEINILLELGCYADFTFPSLQETSQPSFINKIYYATDDPNAPKSYDTGELSRKGLVTNKSQLMIFQGPQAINWSDWRFKTHPTIDDGNLYNEMKPDFDRFELWKDVGIHVQNGPSWVFIRPFTHGCDRRSESIEANIGESMDKMLSEVERKYRDNEKFRLHYVSAREAYNIVKAAEKGLDGNPNQYRDFVIKPYLYSAKDF